MPQPLAVPYLLERLPCLPLLVCVDDHKRLVLPTIAWKELADVQFETTRFSAAVIVCRTLIHARHSVEEAVQ